MNILSVKGRAFLLAFIPMLFITSVLSVYFISGQLSDIDNEINERGKMIARHLAQASEYGVFSGNHENLAALLKLSITDKDVESITITDNDGILLAQEPDQTSQNINSPSVLTSNIRTYRHPVLLITHPVDDLSELEHSQDNGQEVLGWVAAKLTTARLEEHQKQIIWNAMYIILAGMIASLLLALWISRGLTIPISRLTNSVQKIEDGDLNINVDHSSSGEIGSLEKGVGSMLDKIRMTQQELQNQVDESTRGLQNSLGLLEKQNQELSDARVEALQASVTKSRFLANMSHEIRTPMNGILGFIRLLKVSDLSNKQNEYLDTIDKSANNLLTLINEILDISAVESGKVKIHNISFDIEKCINDVITLMTPAAKDKDIEITSFITSDIPKNIYAPQDRIKQILINYIGNAIKFSEHELIVIRTTISQNNKQESLIKISVTDKGVGIAENDKCSVFSPFNQLDDTNTKQHSGTGLGLAISKSLAEAIGGEVGVESELGKGSTFWFSFLYKSNISVDTSPNNDPIHNKKTAGKNICEGLNGKNILVAEDNEINTKLIKTILEHEGVNIHHAKNGKEAFDIYANNAVDLILMDIHMPIMSGLDATKQIRNTEKNDHHIPIIGLTANAINEDKIRFETSGIDTVLLKPIAIDNLLYEIKSLIDKYGSKVYGSPNNRKVIPSNDNSDIKTGDELNHLGVNLRLVSSLRNMLIDELPEIKIQLNTHFSSQNWEELREHIHRLLGGTAYCDVPELRKATMSFQASLKGESDSLKNDFEFLLSEIDALTAT